MKRDSPDRMIEEKLAWRWGWFNLGAGIVIGVDLLGIVFLIAGR